MAEILVSTLVDAFGGPVLADAVFTATATSVRSDGDRVVANKPVTVRLVAGVPETVIDLDPSAPDWCWRVRVEWPGIGRRVDRFVAVPDVLSVEWADLVDVDPATLQPDPGAVPAWTAAVGQVAAILADTETARDGAVTAQGLSEAARDAAVLARGIAEIARDGAVVARGASEAARDTSVAASATATTKATEAFNSAAAAEAAKLAAQAVPTTNDTVMASVAANPASAFSTQLNATIAEGAVTATVGKADASTLARTVEHVSAVVPAMQFTGTAAYISAPGSPFNVSSDIDVRVLLSMDDWTPTPASGTTMILASRGLDAGGSQFKFEINNLGNLIFRWSPIGSSAFTAKASIGTLSGVPNGASLWVRAAFDVDNGSSQSELFFYTSSDGVNWDALGASVKTAGVVDFVTASDPLQVGAYAAAGASPLTGRVSEVVVLDGIDGPTLGHFKAGSLPYSDPQGNTWTLTGTGVSLVQPPVSHLSVLPVRAWNEHQVNGATYAQPLTEWGGFQFAAYWGLDRYLRIAKRTIGANDWQVVSFQGVTGAGLLNAQVALDGHNTVAIHADADGYLHVAGNMHGDWIKYMRSITPGDLLGGWETPGMIQPAGSKTGTDEGLVTYPRFLTNPATGQMFFLYRNGGSGNGDTYLNKYDTTTKTWTRVGKIIDGTSTNESAYENTPVFDENGVLHLSFTWAASGSGFNDREDVCYMKSANGGTTWTTITGAAVSLPVTHPTAPVILEAGTGDGLLNQCGMTVDAKGYPHIAHFWAPDGNRNIWHLYWTGTAWAHERVTDLATSGLTWTGLSRPAIIHYAGRLLVIWRHQYEGWRGKVWATDVSVRGQKRHHVLVDADLREWESAPDYRAVRRGSLNLLLSRVNASGSPGSIPGYTEANWARQPVGVLTVDLARFDQRRIHRVPKDRPTDP